MGIQQVRISHTVHIPANTAHVMGVGTYCIIICAVSHKTCSITLTHGILIIKIIKITITITVFKKNRRGGEYHETAAAHTH
jgi:hypothetical protein